MNKYPGLGRGYFFAGLIDDGRGRSRRKPGRMREEERTRIFGTLKQTWDLYVHYYIIIIFRLCEGP